MRDSSVHSLLARNAERLNIIPRQKMRSQSELIKKTKLTISDDLDIG
jgi:hypothetical protein